MAQDTTINTSAESNAIAIPNQDHNTGKAIDINTITYNDLLKNLHLILDLPDDHPYIPMLRDLAQIPTFAKITEYLNTKDKAKDFTNWNKKHKAFTDDLGNIARTTFDLPNVKKMTDAFAKKYNIDAKDLHMRIVIDLPESHELHESHKPKDPKIVIESLGKSGKSGKSSNGDATDKPKNYSNMFQPYSFSRLDDSGNIIPDSTHIYKAIDALVAACHVITNGESERDKWTKTKCQARMIQFYRDDLKIKRENEVFNNHYTIDNDDQLMPYLKAHYKIELKRHGQERYVAGEIDKHVELIK